MSRTRRGASLVADQPSDRTASDCVAPASAPPESAGRVLPGANDADPPVDRRCPADAERRPSGRSRKPTSAALAPVRALTLLRALPDRSCAGFASCRRSRSHSERSRPWSARAAGGRLRDEPQALAPGLVMWDDGVHRGGSDAGGCSIRPKARFGWRWWSCAFSRSPTPAACSSPTMTSPIGEQASRRFDRHRNVIPRSPADAPTRHRPHRPHGGETSRWLRSRSAWSSTGRRRRLTGSDASSWRTTTSSGRDGIQHGARGETDIEVVAQAGDAETAARYVLGHKPTILVLDLSMPGPPPRANARDDRVLARDVGDRGHDAKRAGVRA